MTWRTCSTLLSHAASCRARALCRFSKLQTLEILHAQRHCVERRRRFVFDEVMLHPHSSGLLEDGGPVDLAGAERHVVTLRRVASVDSSARSTAQIFEMHQGPAIGIRREQLGRVLAGMCHPENIHFEADKLRVRFRNEQSEVRPAASLREWTEFITVRMIGEGDARRLEGSAPR